jgi:hypothetical protein
MKGTLEQLKKALKPLGSFKQVQGQLRYNCPVCENELGMLPDKFNLEVSYQKGAHHCWACGQHGTLYGVIKKYGFKEYLDLFKKEKEDFKDFNSDEQKKEVELPKYTKSAIDDEAAFEYLKGRGIEKEKIIQRDIRICFGGVYNGLLIFPSYNKKGELTAIVYHNFKEKQYRKKKNSNFKCFYESFIDKNSLIILVEGHYDALIVPNAIPLLGNEVDEELLSFLAGTRVLLILDSDLDKKIVKNRIKQLRSTCKEVLKYDLSAIRKDLNEFYTKDEDMLRKELRSFYI